jgi:pterin-4a-carbinolamine dehydratase
MNATKSVSLNPQEAGGGTVVEMTSARRPVTAPTRLKAERVQLSAESTRSRLKAERVQEKIRGLPGWRVALEGQAIDRVRQFRDPTGAAIYVDYVTRMATHHRQPFGLDYLGNRVGVTLWAKPEHGRPAGLNEAVLNFARTIG